MMSSAEDLSPLSWVRELQAQGQQKFTSWLRLCFSTGQICPFTGKESKVWRIQDLPYWTTNSAVSAESLTCLVQALCRSPSFSLTFRTLIRKNHYHHTSPKPCLPSKRKIASSSKLIFGQSASLPNCSGRPPPSLPQDLASSRPKQGESEPPTKVCFHGDFISLQRLSSQISLVELAFRSHQI